MPKKKKKKKIKFTVITEHIAVFYRMTGRLRVDKKCVEEKKLKIDVNCLFMPENEKL